MKTGQDLNKAFNTLWNEGVEIMPTLLIGILILIGGWLIAKLLSNIVKRILVKLKDVKALQWMKLDKMSEKTGLDIDFPVIISKIVYWLVFLFFIVAASETFGWSNVSKEISVFIHYMPKILSALLIFALGYAIATFVRDAVKSVSKSMGVGLGDLLGNILFYFLILIVALTSLSQAGVNISIISTHMYIIIGAFGVAFAVAVGLGAREVVSDLLKNFYNRGVLNHGDGVQYKDITGTVDKITKTSVVIASEGKFHVVPSKDFYESSYVVTKKAE